MMLRISHFSALAASILLANCGQATEVTKPPVSAHNAEPEITYDMSAWKEMQPSWFEPAEPYRIIGNIYSVGTKGLAVYFIAGDAGHVLIDGGMPGEHGQILKNIDALGFDPKDIEIILNSHAHFDHSGGLAALKAETGAVFMASEADRSALEGGFYLGAEENARYGAPPIKVDRELKDKQDIVLGNIAITPRITPGHSRGCTSFWMDAEEAGDLYETMIFCSASVAGNRLLGPPQYEGIVGDYRKTFELTKSWSPDVFLAGHPSFFKMRQKREAQLAGDALAFVDAAAFPEFIARMARNFERDLNMQRAALKASKP